MNRQADAGTRLVDLTFDDALGIARVTINRPNVLNAIDVPTARALHDAVVPLTSRRGICCIVLRGAGKAFVAGGDVARFADDFDQASMVIDELLDALHPVIEVLAHHDAPVLASIRGVAAGAGLSLLAGADLAIATVSSRFLMAYDRIGATPDCGGSWYLPRKIGVGRAAELMMLGETWNAEKALAAGLVNRVVADDDLEAETDALAAKLAKRPTLSLGAYKRLATTTWQNSLARQLEAERAAFKQATMTADFREGVSAFLAHREPDFSGK